jgi:hypothetical protein
MDGPQQQYDGVSRSMEHILPISSYPQPISSRPMLDIASMGLHHTIGPHPHSHMAASNAFTMPMMSAPLTAGFESAVEKWLF